MQINISGHHVQVTSALRRYVEEKFSRLERHFDQMMNVQVILSVDKLAQKAESTIRVSGRDVFANAESEDLYAAVDMLTDKLDRQLIKHKEKNMGRSQQRNIATPAYED